jgi:ornithine cyclodeaminase/alanine dehydrogenase-like protein (mu-crystallin family)
VGSCPQKVLERVNLQIAMGERLYTRYGFRPVMERHAAEMSGRLSLDIRVADSAEEVAREAEVLITATTG